jgi:UDP-N-acetylmuramate dehydrogenase
VSEDALEIDGNVPLAERTTLGVGGAAELFAEVRSEAMLLDALDFARAHELPVTILGGGSNVVVPDAGVSGLVLRVAPRGFAIRDEGARVRLTAAAGEPWDEVVGRSVDEGLAGLEALSGIPGLTGAVPVQNVGAYGQEVADTIDSVRVVERGTGELRDLSASECGFGYRSSVWKRAPGERVVVAVTFALRRGLAAPPRNGELSRALGGASAAPLGRVRDAVLALRRAKSMTRPLAGAPPDENARSAGSFFTNPVVGAEDAARLVERAVREAAVSRAEDVPRWVEPDGRVKLAAGWLIEQSGFAKGTRRGAVGLSTRHALALVCHEGATATALLAFADEVRDTVHARFGVLLEREPVLLGA